MGTRVVMTCHAEAWAKYGRQMVETFVRHWPNEITLYVYAEDFDVDVKAENVIQRELPGWHTDWKARHRENPDAHGRNRAKFGKIAARKGHGYDYRRDCVRFSHKVAALTDLALRSPIAEPGWLIMCDADVLTHDPVTIDWLQSLVTEPQFYIAWLNRAHWYPECGFVIFREDHHAHRDFMRAFEQTYSTDHVFQYAETHDSFVLQQLVGQFVHRKQFIAPFGLSSKIGQRSSHPFYYSRLAERLDHAKGKFKDQGRTPRNFGSRSEAHWK
jgi:hypothetical protein